MITDALGGVIYNRNVVEKADFVSVDTRTWAAGLYIVQLIGANGTISNKKLEIIH